MTYSCTPSASISVQCISNQTTTLSSTCYQNDDGKSVFLDKEQCQLLCIDGLGKNCGEN